MADKTPERITSSYLRSQYGFSDKWLKRLGPPDAEAPNPHPRGAAPVKLYDLGRVRDFIAANEEFREWLKGRAKRQAAAAKGVETRYGEERRQREARAAQAAEWARQVKVTLHDFPSDLWQAAEVHFVDRERQQGEPFPAELNDREVVAFLRHVHTNYDELLAGLESRYGGEQTWRDLEALAQAAAIIRDRVNQKVCRRPGFDYSEDRAEDGLPW